ncbi:MAG: UvrD-helicase domain-containing protein, partial [Candidatus Atribacteria bacterium]|nr:UvrD-helicase domain-containing protein [Candidatus Atribacteria bacterium]
AVTNYRSFRDEHSLLNFQDLLLTTANLLRENPDIRQSIKKKYQTILVDEFQDTDPIQAEIFFYLTGLENEEKDWRKLVPRAGSLFIVGDPQQSIYHFRRADISVYHQVKNMIQTNKGRIVRLNTNFRSVHSIGEYLNPLFNDLFSSQKSSFQAEYSPMKTIRDEGEGYFSGVYKIAISKEKNQSNTIANDARAIAGLIRDWVDRKVRILRSEEELNQGKTLEVQYSDFMLMLRYKKGMEIYARIMVEYGIPITVSGYSSISQSQIVREFLKLLRLLRDPENQVLMVAVLRGMFYGFSDDDLYQFKESGGEFTLFSSIPERLKKDVKQRFKDVFAQLKLYYSWSLKLLPINVLEKILISSGLHPYACIKNKGSNHLNELYFILEYLKKLEMVDFYTYHGLIEKMEKLYKSGIEEEFDFMAEENVVRIMNLHKAKGLEAPIVFLTVSEHNNKPDPKYYIERLAGIPQGYFLVQKEHDFGKGKILAQPLHWKEYCRLENDYLKAEEIRLLYVAATRARNALIISGFGQNSSQTPWEPLLKNIQSEMILDIPAKHVFEKVEIAYPFELFKQQEQKIGTMYEIAMRSSYVEQIPSSAKQFEKNADRYVFPIQGNGRNWGIIVHKVLEYLVDKQPGKELLSLYIDSVLEKYNLPEYQKSGLTQLVENFKVSQLFYRIQNSLAKYVEMPFCVKVAPSDTLYQELVHGQNPEEEIKFMIMKGVIDLLFKERDGWVIVDYKTGFAKKENQDQEINRVYQHQINIYASIWERMSEEKVKEKIIYYL